MIKFEDFIKAPDPKKTKVKFNTHTGDPKMPIPAWDLLLEDDPYWIGMNAYKSKQSNNNLNKAEYLIALAQYYPYGSEYFIFGGMFRVEKVIPEIFGDNGYNLFLMDEYKEYIKRLMIKIDKPIGRDVYNRKYESLQEQLNPEIYELAPSAKFGHFPGYQSVRLKHSELIQIILQKVPSWKQALSNVKGVYVITDTSNGKLYIGSAYGNRGIWQRWSEYADTRNLTGGNKGFIEILETKDNDYIIKNFKYSILEIFDTKTKVETIIERENYWKSVFDTRKHGMNLN